MKYIEQDLLILIHVLPPGITNDGTIVMHPKIIVYHKRVIYSIVLQEKFYLNYNTFLNLVNEW